MAIRTSQRLGDQDDAMHGKRPRTQSCVRFYDRIRTVILILLARFGFCRSERAYPLGCSKEPLAFYDYQKNVFPPPGLEVKTVDDYLIVQRLGTGKFSDVFEAVDVQVENQTLGILAKETPRSVDPRTVVVLKCLKPVSERKVRREILILQHASKLPNLARIKALVLPKKLENGETIGVPTLVLQHAGPDCRWLSHYGGGATNIGGINDKTAKEKDAIPDDEEDDTTLSEYEIRYYIFHLLVALDCLHQKGIMHRDVKPRNCLIRRLGYTGDRQHLFSSLYMTSPQPQTTLPIRGSPLMLIDLGLADFYLPNQKYNIRVASRHYKAPELLVGFEYYDYALDLWGVGCVLASLLCFREPFFRGKDNLDQLGKIIMQLGTTDLLSYILRYEIKLDPEVQKLIQSYHATGRFLNRKPWINEAKDGNHREIDSKGADLLNHLLVYDHEKRWTARQAMEHPFFDVVRRRVLTEVRAYTPSDVSLPSLSTP